MAIIGGRLAELILNRYSWRNGAVQEGYEGQGKLKSLFRAALLDRVRNKTVLDFGCGHGLEAIALARYGAKEVIGVDFREDKLVAARVNQADQGIANCTFVSRYSSKVDVVLSLDSFEHFDRPDVVLSEMAGLLKPDGFVMFSFGWTWYHPRGGHLPLFPWAHILLTEESLMKWRSKYKTDGAKHFGDVAGGLNQMTIAKFEQLVANSPLRFETLELVPIRAVRPLHCRLTREFFTATLRGTLVHR